MKKILGVALLLSICLYSVNVYAVGCPNPPVPKLNFSMKKTKTRFDLSKNTQQLTRESKKNGGASAPGWINEGIMSTKFPNYQITAKVNSMTYPKLGKACHWVEEVNFFWVFQPTISIANEYKKGSCKYNTIIAHERQHVKIDIAVLLKHKDKIKRNLEIQTSRPIATGLIDSNNNINLLNIVEKKLKPVIDKMVGERVSRQGKIDTVEEYTRLGKQCKN